MDEDLKLEMEQFKVDNIHSGLSDGERSLMLKKLLGPLLEPGLLTPRESAYFFLASAQGKTVRAIATAMGKSIGTVQDTIASAKKKLLVYRKTKVWE